MFKGFKLKQMALLANNLVTQNQDVFDKFGTDIEVTSSSSYICTSEIKGINYITTFSFTSSYQPLKDGGIKINSLSHVCFCMNSIYNIAKGLNIDPLILVEETINDLCNSLRSDGVYYPDVNTIPYGTSNKSKQKVFA